MCIPTHGNVCTIQFYFGKVFFKCAYKSHMLNAGCLTKICSESTVISYGFVISQMLLSDGQIRLQKAAKTIFQNITALTYSPVTTEKISNEI